MIFWCRWGCGLWLGAAIGSVVSIASAEPLRLHAEGGAARAISGSQKRETTLGWTGAGAVELGLTRELGVQLELSTVTLGAGGPPSDPTLAPKSTSSGQAVMGGLRARPFASKYDGQRFSAAGIWIDANAGAMRTADLTRATFDAHVGFDVTWDKFAAGPYGGYVHVLQPNDALRPDDGHLIVAGLHVMIGSLVSEDRDRDGDGIPDRRDKCPDQPEDRDGYQDQDGCPDPDNDADSVMDYEDACPNMAGTRSGDPKTNGCPVGDRDHDGIMDDVDRCPDEPEDQDGFQDQDGCPDPDNDKDGIPDVNDKCPNEPETVNGYADDDGCPDDVQVRVVGDKILLDDRVHFETNRYIVLADSQPLLWRVAQIIVKHPEYAHVEVEGYADERGEESYNQKLSENRAKAVLTLLVKYGVSRERLTSVGFGTSNPRVPSKSDVAYRQNRRVEFKITRETKDTVHTDALPAPRNGAKEGETR
jgi:outer membrane protein OmpA-like peptidoglycan-associated protein